MQQQPAQPGWYEVPGLGEIRWRDGAHWTAYRVANGVPGANWYAVEPPLIGYAFGAIFLALGLMQLFLAIVGDTPPVNAILMCALAAFWFGGAISTTNVRRLPHPASGPIAFEAVEPLPGRVEGPGAGWYPVSSRASRWWSGARWGHYLIEAGRVRPTFTGPKTYRALIVTGWVFAGLGALALAAGIVAMSVAHGSPAFWVGVFLLVGGIVVGVVGAIVFPVTRLRRSALLLPEQPPRS